VNLSHQRSDIGDLAIAMTSSSSSSNSKSTTSTSVMKSPSRRVVKASPPPSIKLEDREPTAVTQDQEDTEPDTKKMVPAAIKDPVVMHEMEQELNDRWREERLHAVAGNQDKRRDKKIDEIRKHPPTPQNSANDIGEIESRVLPEFSVQPQFPEHKRSVEKSDTVVDEEPVEKRMKASDPDDDEPDNKENSFWGAFKSALPAIAVAGIAILVATKYMKKR